MGQILLSVRTIDRHRATAVEALRRSMYKFPGRQKIIVSILWGFTPLPRAEYIRLKEEGLLRNDGSYVQVCRRKGEVAENIKAFPQAYNSPVEMCV